jgi:hypothetical protein
MKTPVKVAIEIIEDLDTNQETSETLKVTILHILSLVNETIEGEHLTRAFMDGKKTPSLSSYSWYLKKYGKVNKTLDDSE